MSGVMDRTLGILELLAQQPEGLQVSALAADLNMPVSAAHRLLNDLSRHGYVRQARAQGEYALTIKMAALGLSYLGATGVADIAQPILNRLAAESKELVRLSVIDAPNLVWVAVAQGAQSGLRYDPGREQGQVAHLATSASGLAWLSALSDDEALKLVASQGLTPPTEVGPNAPKSMSELLSILEDARKRGYAVAVNSFIAGMAAMAVPVRAPKDGALLGSLSIAGPECRLRAERMAQLIAPLQAAADELAEASAASSFFNPDRAPAHLAAARTA